LFGAEHFSLSKVFAHPHRSEILRGSWSDANAYSNTDCKRKSDCNTDADSKTYTYSSLSHNSGTATVAPHWGNILIRSLPAAS